MQTKQAAQIYGGKPIIFKPLKPKLEGARGGNPTSMRPPAAPYSAPPYCALLVDSVQPVKLISLVPAMSSPPNQMPPPDGAARMLSRGRVPIARCWVRAHNQAKLDPKAAHAHAISSLLGHCYAFLGLSWCDCLQDSYSNFQCRLDG